MTTPVTIKSTKAAISGAQVKGMEVNHQMTPAMARGGVRKRKTAFPQSMSAGVDSFSVTGSSFGPMLGQGLHVYQRQPKPLLCLTTA